jgi:hypothetical protein
MNREPYGAPFPCAAHGPLPGDKSTQADPFHISNIHPPR